MPAWRILICLFFVMGIALSAEASSSGVATLRITVAHVPTAVQSAFLADASGDESAASNCIRSSVHAAPHRVQPLEGSQPVSSGDILWPGTEACVESAPALAAMSIDGLVAVRVIPE